MKLNKSLYTSTAAPYTTLFDTTYNPTKNYKDWTMRIQGGPDPSFAALAMAGHAKPESGVTFLLGRVITLNPKP